jgi:hypothetical protein
MTTPYMAVPTAGDFDRGMEERFDKNRSRRLANREAMLKFGNEAAMQGQAIGVDDWAEQAKSVLGVDDFLNSTAPSADMLAVMQKNQNSQAAQVAEERRRAQFRSDADEATLMEQEVVKQASSGKSEAEIASWGTKTFGSKFDRVVPRLQSVINRATLDGRRQGFETYGATFNGVDEARDFITANPGLTEWEKNGITERARKNEFDLEQRVIQAADRVASSGGFVDGEAFRNYIAQVLPSGLSAEKRASLVDRAVQTARGAAQVALAAGEQKNASQIQLQEGLNATQERFQLYNIEQAEQQRREKLAGEMAGGFSSRVQAQQGFIKALDAAKSPLAKELGGKLIEATTFLGNYIVDDPEEYVQALKTDNKEKLARIRARAVPIQAYQQRATRLSQIVTGAQALGTADAGYKAIENLMADSMANNLPAQGKVMSDLMATASVTRGMSPEARATANAKAQVIRAKFTEDVSEVIRQARQAITANGTVTATPDQMADNEYRMVSGMVDRFLSGASLTTAEKQDMRVRMIASSMSSIGATTGIVARPTGVQILRGQGDAASTLRNTPKASGYVVPGSIQPGARQGVQPVQPTPTTKPLNVSEQGMKSAVADVLAQMNDPAVMQRELASAISELPRARNQVEQDTIREYITGLQAKLGARPG